MKKKESVGGKGSFLNLLNTLPSANETSRFSLKSQSESMMMYGFSPDHNHTKNLLQTQTFIAPGGIGQQIGSI